MGQFPRTPYQEKYVVRDMMKEILTKFGLGWGDLMSDERSKKVREARERISVIAYNMLVPWMSEVEIADFVGMKRSTFREARKRWASQQDR